jgi:branched-chain amino acid transport system substrate-binding protein
MRACRRLVAASLFSSLAMALAPASLAQTIKIGAIGPFSGPGANTGLEIRKGWEAVAEEVNKAGGLDLNGRKHKLTVLFEDSQSRPEVGMSAAQKLLGRDNVDLLVADMFVSSVTLAVMELVPSFNKVMLTGNPVSAEISRKIASDPKKFANVWKFNFNTDAYASTAYQTIKGLSDSGQIKLPNKTVAYISEESDYGKSQVEALNSVFQAAGWKVVSSDFMPLGAVDFYPQISKLRGMKPDLLISNLTVANSGAALVRQLREQALPSFHFGVFYPSRAEFMKAAGKDAEGLVHAPLFFDPTNNPKHAALRDKLKGLMGGTDPSTNHVWGYCNAKILLDAVSRAGSVEASKVNAAFAKTNYDCTIGRWAFKPEDHSPRMGPEYLAIPAAQVQDGQWRAIWPPTVATGKYRAAP